MEYRPRQGRHSTRVGDGLMQLGATQCEVHERQNELHEPPIGVLLRTQGLGDRQNVPFIRRISTPSSPTYTLRRPSLVSPSGTISVMSSASVVVASRAWWPLRPDG